MAREGSYFRWHRPSAFYSSRCVTPVIKCQSRLKLPQPVFGAYNDKVKRENKQLEKRKAKISPEEYELQHRDEIDFGIHQNEIEQFKLKHIYERMREEEAKANVCVSTPPS